MRAVTLSVKEARELDRRAQEEFGIPSILLMESAGQCLANAIRVNLIPPTQSCQVVFICGTGNNGGDGYVAARHLFQRGLLSRVFVAGDTAALSTDAGVNYRIIQNLGIPCEPLESFASARASWDRKPVVLIDAVVGTGFRPPLRPAVATAIHTINDFRKTHNSTVRIISVDIPSGLDGDEGPVQPDVVRATLTVTFACHKPGLLLPASHPYVGRLELADIGIPEKLMSSVAR